MLNLIGKYKQMLYHGNNDDNNNNILFGGLKMQNENTELPKRIRKVTAGSKYLYI